MRIKTGSRGFWECVQDHISTHATGSKMTAALHMIRQDVKFTKSYVNTVVIHYPDGLEASIDPAIDYCEEANDHDTDDQPIPAIRIAKTRMVGNHGRNVLSETRVPMGEDDAAG